MNLYRSLLHGFVHGPQARRWLVLGLQLLMMQGVFGQTASVPTSRLGVDRVGLTSGQRLLGFVLARPADGGLRVAVERAWLATAYPELSAQQSEAEGLQQAAARETLVTRMKAWMQERAGDAVLMRSLEAELEELDQLQTDSVATFHIFELAKQDYRSLKWAAPENRKIAGLAYQNKINNVNTTSVIVLARELEALGVDLETSSVDLTDQLPSVSSDSPQQWAARQALFEYQFREPLEYQGTGTDLFRTGEEQDVMAIAQQMMGGSSANAIMQLGADLGLPEFKRPAQDANWWKKTCAQAEQAGFRGVLIKRLQPAGMGNVAKVSGHFFAQLKPGDWFEVFQFTAASSLNEQSADRIAQLEEDPQVKQLKSLADSLGLGGGQLDRALRQGAATQNALEQVNEAFGRMLARYIENLDRPTIDVVSQ